MKFYLTICLVFMSAFILKADDLTFIVNHTVKGGSTGSIDMTISGGAAPFSITWTGPNGFTAQTEDISNLAIGTYTVTVNDNYCGTATATVIVKDFTTGVEEMSAEHISVFPNPATTTVTIMLPDLFKHYQLSLRNALGELVLIKEDIATSTATFSVAELEAGIYLVELIKDHKAYRKKIIKY